MSEIHHREATTHTKPRLYRVTEADKLSGLKVQVIFHGIATGQLRRAPGASGYGSLIAIEDLEAFISARNAIDPKAVSERVAAHRREVERIKATHVDADVHGAGT
jgi:hypothetical protein